MNKRIILCLILVSLLVALPVSALSFSDAITGFLIKPITNLFTGKISFAFSSQPVSVSDQPVSYLTNNNKGTDNPPEGAFSWREVTSKGKCVVSNPSFSEACIYYKKSENQYSDQNPYGCKDFKEYTEDCTTSGGKGRKWYCVCPYGKGSCYDKQGNSIPEGTSIYLGCYEEDYGKVKTKLASKCNMVGGQFEAQGKCDLSDIKGKRKVCSYKLPVGCWDSDAYVGPRDIQQFYKGHTVALSIRNDKLVIDNRWDKGKRGTRHKRIYEHTCSGGRIVSHNIGCPSKESDGVCKCDADFRCSIDGTQGRCIDSFCKWFGKKPENSFCEKDEECISNICSNEKCAAIPNKEEIKDEIKQELDIPDEEKIKQDIMDELELECQGCTLNDGTCVPIGHRWGGQTSSFYCSADSKIEEQRKKDNYCQNNYECISNICSNGECVEIPEEPEIPCLGCDYNNKCVPVGFRTADSYCPETGGILQNQLDEDSDCKNNFECKSNICLDGKCINPEEYRKNLICTINPEADICS